MNRRLLVAYCNASTFVSTTAEYLESIARYSDFDVRFVHATHGAKLAFELDEFDAVFHNYCARLPFSDYVSPNYLAKLKAFRGLKILAVQDEYDHTNALRCAIRDLGFHAVLTCVPPSMLQAIYPRKMFPRTEFITVLTGYVPEHLPLQAKWVRPLRDRPIGIGYRGRDIGGRYGRLAFEKLEIGRRMREICAARGISHDIEWTDDKRLYGPDWYNFIASCRANLGSESGSNVFDFDGNIEAKYKELQATRGGPVPYEEFRVYTDPIEAEYDMGQISPRVFEAAAMRTPMILFTGRYSGIIEPDAHYIELKKDFSNVDEVLDRLHDLDALEHMAGRAYDRLVGSGEFCYRQFVRLLDAIAERKMREFGVWLRPSGRSHASDGNVVDPSGLDSLEELPTDAPRHYAVFQSRQLAQQNVILTGEITRLNRVYKAEIVRLNTSLTTETGRLHDAYMAEIARLHDVIRGNRRPNLRDWFQRSKPRIPRGARSQARDYLRRLIGPLGARIVRQVKAKLALRFNQARDRASSTDSNM